MIRTGVTQSNIFRRLAWAALLASLLVLSNGCGGKTVSKADASASQPAGNPETSTGIAADSSVRGHAAELDSRDTAAERGRIAFAPVVIPSGRALSVRLLQTVSSRTANPGERFDAELAAPLAINGQTVLPRGTPLRGRVVSARPSGRLHKPGYLRLTLIAFQAPGGRWVDLKTTSVAAMGKSHKKRNLALIGGGTGVGALIGAIASGGTGAAIGAASGAGAGTVGAYATGKKDVTFSAERRLSFSTVRQVEIG